MAHPDGLAGRILKLEQQLKAYERLHAEELAELWQALNECKRAIADDLPAFEPNHAKKNGTKQDPPASRETIAEEA